MTWEPSAKDTEGADLKIDHYNVYCALKGQEATPIDVGSVVEYWVDLQPGLNECQATAVAKFDGKMVESDLSNVAIKTIIVRPRPIIITFSGTMTIQQ